MCQYITKKVKSTEIIIISDSKLAAFQEGLIVPYLLNKVICSIHSVWRPLPFDYDSIFGFVASYLCLLWWFAFPFTVGRTVKRGKTKKVIPGLLRQLIRILRKDGYVTHTTERGMWTICIINVSNICVRQQETILKTKANMEAWYLDGCQETHYGRHFGFLLILSFCIDSKEPSGYIKSAF